MAIDINSGKNRAAELMLALRKDHKFDPLTELFEIYRHSVDIGDKERIKICLELMNFMYPKLKAIELDTKANNPVVFNFDLKGQVKDIVPAAKTELEEYAKAA